ncbi:TnpV protein [Leptotrichia trevisanii]
MKKMRRNWNMLKKMIDGKEYLIENGIYTPVVKETSYEQVGGNYKMILLDEKFQVLVPNLEEEELNLSKLNSWGRARMKYLEQEKAEFLKNLLMKGEVMEHLFSIQKEVEKFWEIEKPKMMKTMGLTEELKEKDQMEWLRLMNNLLSSLREITYNQIIYK